MFHDWGPIYRCTVFRFAQIRFPEIYIQGNPKQNSGWVNRNDVECGKYIDTTHSLWTVNVNH